MHYGTCRHNYDSVLRPVKWGAESVCFRLVNDQHNSCSASTVAVATTPSFSSQRNTYTIGWDTMGAGNWKKEIHFPNYHRTHRFLENCTWGNVLLTNFGVHVLMDCTKKNTNQICHNTVSMKNTAYTLLLIILLWKLCWVNYRYRPANILNGDITQLFIFEFNLNLLVMYL